MGAVVVKGRASAVELFELLACSGSPLERQQKTASNERFQRGLRAYAQGDMERAHAHFSACVEEAPLDRAAVLYRDRARLYAEIGLPTGFDGCLDGL